MGIGETEQGMGSSDARDGISESSGRERRSEIQDDPGRGQRATGPAGRYEAICIYVDGLGAGSHGTPDARRRDARLREQLRSEGYEVIAIAASELGDAGAMAGHLSRLARMLLGKEQARAIKDDTRWFAGSEEDGPGEP